MQFLGFLYLNLPDNVPELDYQTLSVTNDLAMEIYLVLLI